VSRSRYQRVLFIAPDDESLNVIPEQDTMVALGYDVRVLQGRVSDERLFDAVRCGGFDVIHFAGHGNAAGVLLSDGLALAAQGIAQVARQSEARLVFLNACSSAPVGQRLVNAGLPVCVAALREIPDVTARQAAQTFYTILAKTADAHTAYVAACADDYAYLSNGGYVEQAVREMRGELGQLRQFVRWAGIALVAYVLVVAAVLLAVHPYLPGR
jgi:hypothetical protein